MNASDMPPSGLPMSAVPARQLMDVQQRFRLLVAALVAVAAIGLVSVVMVVRLMARPQTVFVVDAAGVIHSGPAGKLDSADGLFRHIMVLASQTILTRTASVPFDGQGTVNLDMPEYVDLMFQDGARQKLLTDVLQGQGEFVAKQLSQKPIVNTLRVLQEKGGERVIAALGRVERTGTFQARVFRENIPFSLVVALVPNPRMDTAGAFPFVIRDFSVKYNDAKAETTPLDLSTGPSSQPVRPR